ncbi:MAG: aspartate kinase, partial [Balneolaceae bacterium]|nr:aspartate kinase [Balneolaceae bacterium]
MRVLKFGGTSMGDEHTWRRVLQIIKKYEQPVVVVSATARTTRQLVAAAELAPLDFGRASSMAIEIKDRHRLLIRNFLDHTENQAMETKEGRKLSEECIKWIEDQTDTLIDLLNQIAEEGRLKPSLKDAVAGIGEQLSSRLFSYCGAAFGLKTTWVDARAVIKTDSNFGNANPNVSLVEENSKEIARITENGMIPVMGGYIGQDAEGAATTLGFEGSDFSASLLGSALNAEAIEIWTDVSGIYTCDPRVVDEAFPIRQLSFQEATEMAYFGAKVLHPSTMNPAEEKQIPILVKNIFEPDQPGTVISGEADKEGHARAITFLKDVSILTVTSPHTRMGYDFLSGIFEMLKQYRLSVNVVTTTEASISLALASEQIGGDLIDAMEQLGEVSRKDDHGIISLIGSCFESASKIRDRVLDALPETHPTMISYSSDKRNLNIVLPEEELVPSVRAIHGKLFGNE